MTYMSTDEEKKMTEINNATTEPTAEEVTAAQAAAAEEVGSQPDDADPKPVGTEEQQSKKPGGVRQKMADLEARLEAAHAQAFDGAVQALGLQPALMRAAGLSVADYVREDGTVDTEALTVAADSKRAELGLPRKPLPNKLAGANQGRELPEKRSLGDVLKSVSRAT